MIYHKNKLKNSVGKLFRENIAIFLILFLALLLRLWGINFGLPNMYHFDESTSIYSAFFASANKLQPHFFYFPMLYSYLLILIYAMYFIYGLVFKFWPAPAQFFVTYLRDPTVFVLLGRFLSVAIAGISILALFFIAKKIYSKKIAIIASLLLAVSFIHVQESHYIKQDILMGLLGLMIFYFSVRIAKFSRKVDYLIIGIIFGLAAAVKYNFFIFLPAFLLAHSLRLKKGHSLRNILSKKIVLTFLTTVVVFFVLNPYIIFQPAKAFTDITTQARLTTIQWVSSDSKPVWLYTITYYLKFGVGELILIFVLLQTILIFFKESEKEKFILLSFPVSFFLTLIIFGGTNFARYILLILPQLLLLAAIFIAKLRSNVLLLIVIVISITPTFIRSIKFDQYINSQDTRAISKVWIEQYIPAGAKIVNEGAVRSEYQSVYGPPLLLNQASIEKLLTQAEKLNFPGTYLKSIIIANQGKIGYDLLGILNLDRGFDSNLNSQIVIDDVEKYIKEYDCYLISSTWAKVNNQKYSDNFVNSLNANYVLIKEFKPEPILREDPVWRVDFIALDKMNLFDRKILSGPTIKIYRSKALLGCL